MTLVSAIQVLFAQAAPAGADFEGAFDALKGKRDSDLSPADAVTLDVLAETFQDFVGDPSGWIKKALPADPRHSWWVKLGQALGASVTTGPAPASAVPSTSPSAVASAVTVAPVVPEPEPEQGIDPDALASGAPPPGRREGGGRKGGGGVVVRPADGDEDDRPRRGKKGTDPVEAPQKEPDAHVKAAPAGGNPDDGKAKPPGDTVPPVAPSPVAPPDLVHGFQSGEDRERLRRELIRERLAASRGETRAARQRRLDAEEQERQRRLTADALERQRRASEEEAAQQLRLRSEEEALARRLAIQAKADEEKKLADQRHAAEQRRLDVEEAERKRLADEAAEERKLQRKEAADARKRLADEEAAQRKRDADEAERLARKDREENEAAERLRASRPKPLIDVTDRTIPAITREILAYGSYRNWSAWLIEAFRLIRAGTPAEQEQKRTELPHMRTLIETMKRTNERMEVKMGYHLERLLEALETGQDQRDPAWFQANYVTGSYG